MKLSNAVTEFKISNEADGLNIKTIEWYQYMLTPFADAFPNARIDEITTNQIRKYVIQLRNKYDSSDTVSGHMRALHRFWRWCSQEYEIKSPMRNVRYPRKPKQNRPKSVNAKDIIRLFEAAGKAQNPPQGLRDKAIIALLADTGVRAAGVVSLKRADIDFGARRIFVIEKRDKSRSIPFSRFTAQLLLTWLNHRRQTEHDHVFYNIHNKEPLTVSGLYQILKRLRKKAGLSGRANPHAFRHSFAREYLKSGGDLATLSRIMGHEDISTTAGYYAIFTENEMSEEHEDHSQIRYLEEGLREANKNKNDEEE